MSFPDGILFCWQKGCIGWSICGENCQECNKEGQGKGIRKVPTRWSQVNNQIFWCEDCDKIGHKGNQICWQENMEGDKETWVENAWTSWKSVQYFNKVCE